MATHDLRCAERPEIAEDPPTPSHCLQEFRLGLLDLGHGDWPAVVRVTTICVAESAIACDKQSESGLLRRGYEQVQTELT